MGAAQACAKRSRLSCGCNRLKDWGSRGEGGFYGVLATEDVCGGRGGTAVAGGVKGSTAGSLKAADE